MTKAAAKAEKRCRMQPAGHNPEEPEPGGGEKQQHDGNRGQGTGSNLLGNENDARERSFDRKTFS